MINQFAFRFSCYGFVYALCIFVHVFLYLFFIYVFMLVQVTSSCSAHKSTHINEAYFDVFDVFDAFNQCSSTKEDYRLRCVLVCMFSDVI